MSSIALCIPAYNAEKFLPIALRSAISQKRPFDEILLYNDCSTDNTVGIAETFGVKIINGDINRGCSYGKNKLAAEVKSEWLFFLDADDFLYPNFTEIFINELVARQRADMYIMGYSYVDVVTNKVLDRSNLNNEELNRDPIKYVIKNRIVNSAVFSTRSFLKIGGFDIDPEILYIEDRAFSIKAALSGFKIISVSNIVFQINRYSESMSYSDPAKWLKAAVHLWRNVFEMTGNKYAEDLCAQLYENAVWSAKYDQWSLVRSSLKLASEIDPKGVPATSRAFQTFYRISPVGAYFAREYLLRIFHKLRKSGSAND